MHGTHCQCKVTPTHLLILLAKALFINGNKITPPSLYHHLHTTADRSLDPPSPYHHRSKLRPKYLFFFFDKLYHHLHTTTDRSSDSPSSPSFLTPPLAPSSQSQTHNLQNQETNFSIQTIPIKFSIQTISKISDPLLCFSLSFSIRFFINGIAHHSSALSFVDLALLLINGVAHCLSAFLVEKRRENHRKTKGEKQGKNEEKRREKRRGE